MGVSFVNCSWLYTSQPTSMNKTIFTSDRIFMSLVAPGGSGKTRLIFAMLTSPTTFYPKLQKTYDFYKDYQPLFKEMAEKMNIELAPSLDFEMIKKLENCLLAFDDSCEEIYQEKEFVKIAVAGRHKKIHCIFVKHILFHQSKCPRTIDLNTTHVVLFKSPRDVQQIDHFGRQLNKSVFIRDCHQKATWSPYGHFLIDFDPKTSESLRFCSNITGPAPTVFYLPFFLAKETALTNEREKRAYTEALAKQKEKVFRKILCNCSADEVKFLCECALKIINGNIPFNVDRLVTYEKQLKILCNAKTSDRKRRRILTSNKGIN